MAVHLTNLTANNIIISNTSVPVPAYITIPDPNMFGTPDSDYFGNSSAIFGSYAIAAARRENNQGGAAYIIDTADGTVLHSVGPWNGSNAVDVSISANYAVIGAPSAPLPYNGAFAYDVNTGALVHTFSGIAGTFGYTVANTDQYAVISAPTSTVSSTAAAGNVLVYELSGGTLVRTIPDPGTVAANDNFGNALALSGDLAVILAPGKNSYTGLAYIVDITTGAVNFTLTPPSGGLFSGSWVNAVGISSNYTVVSDTDKDGGKGQAHVYSTTTGAYLRTLTGTSLLSSSYFGSSISVVGDYAVIGAPGQTTPAQQGRAFLFNLSTGDLVKEILYPGTPSSYYGGAFGISTGMDSTNIIIGAQTDGTAGEDAGAAFIFPVT